MRGIEPLSATPSLRRDYNNSIYVVAKYHSDIELLALCYYTRFVLPMVRLGTLGQLVYRVTILRYYFLTIH